MATVTKTIGTSGRDYSTIAAWEADLDEDTEYSDGDHTVGEMYADSTFTGATTTINGGSDIGGSASDELASVKLTVHADSRHDGTAESGALLKPTSGSGHNIGIIRIDVDNVTVEWLDISLDSLDSTDTNKAITLVGTNDDNIIRNNLIHDKDGNPGSNGSFMIHTLAAGATSDTLTIQNNIIYNIVETASDGSSAIVTNTWQGTANIYNNTIYNIDSAGTSKKANGIVYGNDADATINVKNNLVAKMVADGGTSNERAYRQANASSTLNASNNLSDDTITNSAYKAPGSDSLQDKTLAEISFVSTTGGSEDLHISSGSDCIDAGVDLGTTNGVEIDINGRNRDSNGDTWDIGAHEFVADAATTGAAFMMFVD